MTPKISTTSHPEPNTSSSEMSSERSIHHPTVATVLAPFTLVYMVIGNLAIMPVCFELIILLITDIIKIHGDISESLAKREEHQREMANSIVALGHANQQLEELRAKHTMDEAARKKHETQLAASNEWKQARLLNQVTELKQKIGDLCKDLENVRAENVKLADVHRAEVSTLRSKMKEERDESVLLIGALKKDTDDLRNRAEKLKVDNFQLFKDAKKEAVRAREGLESRDSQAATAPAKVSSRLASELPHDLQSLDPLSAGFTCIGTTKKGLRCGQYMISNEAKSAAAKRLAIMRSPNPGDTFKMPKLFELASWMLCPRWHNKDAQCPQPQRIASKWSQELKNLQSKIVVEKLSERATEKRPITPIKSAPLETPQKPSLPPSSAHSSVSSTSSVFSSASFGSLSSPVTSPESSPLAKKTSGKRAGVMRS